MTTTCPEPGTAELRWYKARRSTGQNDCVEIACTQASVLIRDSKNPDGDRLAVTPHVWESLIAAIKDGGLT